MLNCTNTTSKRCKPEKCDSLHPYTKSLRESPTIHDIYAYMHYISIEYNKLSLLDELCLRSLFPQELISVNIGEKQLS